jgi:hypothetical protein
MIQVRRQYGPILVNLYELAEERVIAQNMTKADAETIAALLNQATQREAQAKVNRKLDKITAEQNIYPGLPFRVECVCPFCTEYLARQKEKP